jgi:hypothetical protein
MAQASCSQPDGGFFSRKTFTAWFMLLQILKSMPSYFYTTVEIVRRCHKLTD